MRSDPVLSLMRSGRIRVRLTKALRDLTQKPLDLVTSNGSKHATKVFVSAKAHELSILFGTVMHMGA